MAYRDEILLDQPEGYWRFGEPSGATVTDETGNHNGSYVGSPTLGLTGALLNDSNTAFREEGGTKYASIPTNTKWDPLTGDFTIEIWVWLPSNWPATQYWHLFSSAYNGTTQGWWFGCDNDAAGTTAIFQMRDGANPGGFIRVASSLTKNAWNYMVGVYDKTNQLGSIYVNGKKIIGPNTIGKPSVALTSPLLFGASDAHTPTGSSAPIIDEGAFYTKQLSASRIDAHWRAGAVGRFELVGAAHI
jgi:hypothetical protein